MIGETLAIFGRSFTRVAVIWGALLLISVGTDLISLIYGAGAGRAFSMLEMLSLLVRFVGVFWLAAAVLRVFAGSPPRPTAFDGGVVFFFGWQIALLIAGAMAEFALWPVETKVEPLVSSFANPPVVVLVCVALAQPAVDLLTLRILPWVVAKTAHLSTTGVRGAWRGMRGQWGAAAGAYLVLVFPLFAIHYALNAWLPHAELTQAMRAGWTVFDGVESIFMLMMLLALYLATYERVKLAKR